LIPEGNQSVAITSARTTSSIHSLSAKRPSVKISSVDYRIPQWLLQFFSGSAPFPLSVKPFAPPQTWLTGEEPPRRYARFFAIHSLIF
jgi:hypothetical protein